MVNKILTNFRIYFDFLRSLSTKFVAVSCRSESSNYKLGRFTVSIV